jgi:hypothetical protein
MRKFKASQFRQGDVLLEGIGGNVKAQPHKTVPRDGGRIILAYGEVTGHAHAICEQAAEQIALESGERFVCSEIGIRLVHEEHGAINLPAGNYRVVRQREYTPEEIRNVAD